MSSVPSVGPFSPLSLARTSEIVVGEIARQLPHASVAPGQLTSVVIDGTAYDVAQLLQLVQQRSASPVDAVSKWLAARTTISQEVDPESWLLSFRPYDREWISRRMMMDHGVPLDLAPGIVALLGESRFLNKDANMQVFRTLSLEELLLYKLDPTEILYDASREARSDWFQRRIDGAPEVRCLTSKRDLHSPIVELYVARELPSGESLDGMACGFPERGIALCAPRSDSVALRMLRQLTSESFREATPLRSLSPDLFILGTESFEPFED